MFLNQQFLGVKGKEKQTVGELYDLFESVRLFTPTVSTLCQKNSQLADELWPEETAGSEGTRVGSTAEELSLEAQIANEMSSIQKSRKEKRFGSDASLTSVTIHLMSV